MNLYCTCRCSSFLFVHMIFWLLILIAHCIFKKVLQHFVVSAISATMMLLVVKKLWNKQIPIKTFPVQRHYCLLWKIGPDGKKTARFSLHALLSRPKKIDPSVIYRKASPDQEVWWERAIWAISDPGKDFDAGKLHSSMWKLFHMEESASAASVFLFTRCEKAMGDVMRDLPQASEPLCATELLLGKANQASLQLSTSTCAQCTFHPLNLTESKKSRLEQREVLGTGKCLAPYIYHRLTIYYS